MGFLLYVISTILALVGIRKYREYKWGRCNNTIKLSGKVAIVTGANSGIGYEIAKELAARDAQVIIGCRNLEAAKKAVSNIKQNMKHSTIILPMELDLQSIESIRQFAEKIKSNYSKIHILVNNAGVAFPNNNKPKTKHGFEIHLGINHLGHFLLTNLLIELLEKAESSRILVISSLLHEKGQINLNDLNLEKATEKTNAYANSKLANIYFCKELEKRLKNTNVKVFAVLPGWVYTNLFRHHNFQWYQYIFLYLLAFLFMKTPKQGAQTAIYCATEHAILSGCYRNCTTYKTKIEINDSTSEKLWQISEEMIKDAEAKIN